MGTIFHSGQSEFQNRNPDECKNLSQVFETWALDVWVSQWLRHVKRVAIKWWTVHKIFMTMKLMINNLCIMVITLQKRVNKTPNPKFELSYFSSKFNVFSKNDHIFRLLMDHKKICFFKKGSKRGQNCTYLKCIFNEWNNITRHMSKIQWVQEITVSNILLCPHLLNFPWSTCCSRIMLRSAYPFISFVPQWSLTQNKGWNWFGGW